MIPMRCEENCPECTRARESDPKKESDGFCLFNQEKCKSYLVVLGTDSWGFYRWQIGRPIYFGGGKFPECFVPGLRTQKSALKLARSLNRWSASKDHKYLIPRRLKKKHFDTTKNGIEAI